MAYFNKHLFEINKQFGKCYEKESLKYIEYDTYKFKEGFFSYYDYYIKLNGEKIRYEVKSDRMACRTGHIVIEYRNGDKLTGISISKADYWIYFTIYNNYNVVYKFKTEELKELCENYGTIKGGQGGVSHMYRIPISDIKEYIIEKI